MRRLKTQRFIIRIWFKEFKDSEGFSGLRHREEILLGFKSRVESYLLPTAGPDAVVRLADDFFDDTDNIAAMEVLSAANWNGIVSYYEWP